MCLIAFAHNVHTDYPLILIANRDEFYNRPTRAAQFWTTEGFDDILAGKDLKAGGTWIGLHKNKRWAALTNYRNLHNLKENPPSRGSLVLDFIKSNSSAENYLGNIQKDAALYNDFNLLLFDGKDIAYYSNISNTIQSVSNGIHGLSNALLDTPWKKVDRIKSDLENAIQNNHLEKDFLFDLLCNEDKANPEDLPSTGLSLELEKAMSSIFIHTPFYGTRCSTIILKDKNGKVSFTERKYSENKEILGEVNYEIES